MSHPPVCMLSFSKAASVNVDETRVSPGLLAAVNILASSGATQDELRDQVQRLDGDAGLVPFYYVLEQWMAAGLICRTLVSAGETLVTWVPMTPGIAFGLAPLRPDTSYVLSRFVYSRRDGAQLVLESPLCPVQLRLHDGRGAQLLALLSTPHAIQDFAGASAELETETIEVFTELLHHAGMLSEIMADGRPLDETSLPLATWEFHDLTFHSRSRGGRHNNPMGGIYRFEDQLEPLPVTKPPMSAKRVPLTVPDLSLLAQHDIPLSQVLEARRSIRQHGELPITIEELGRFLYRVARVRELFSMPHGQLSSRPYPSAGAIYELELYILVQHCTGLHPGLYHYAPRAHELESLGEPTPYTEMLLQDAMAASGWKAAQPPQLLIIVTARFSRLSWKYASIAYALLLKHVGVLYQTMYLVATAMELAPCAIGGGDAEVFAKAAGVDYYAETSVGEFLLGSR